MEVLFVIETRVVFHHLDILLQISTDCPCDDLHTHMTCIEHFVQIVLAEAFTLDQPEYLIDMNRLCQSMLRALRLVRLLS